MDLSTNSGLMETLSVRERDVLIFLVEGMSYRQISERLYVSQNTIKYHVKNVYSKLGVKDRLRAANTARVMRLLD